MDLIHEEILHSSRPVFHFSHHRSRFGKKKPNLDNQLATLRNAMSRCIAGSDWSNFDLNISRIALVPACKAISIFSPLLRIISALPSTTFMPCYTVYLSLGHDLAIHPLELYASLKSSLIIMMNEIHDWR